MKTTKSIIALLFVLLTTQAALAWYDPSTQRWLTRDPIGELGFETLRAATQTANQIVNVSAVPTSPSRWITRDSMKRKPVSFAEGEQNRYFFVNNRPTFFIDREGLAPSCGSGFSLYLAPDEYWAFNISVPCDNHDNCYSTCGKSKSQCDLGLFNDIQSVCDQLPWYNPFVIAECRNVGIIYYGAVHFGGNQPYQDAQKAAGCNNCPKK
jgi:hypothetical protein